MISPVTETKQAATSPGSVADATINQSRALQGFFFFPALSECFERAMESIAIFHSVNVVFIASM